MIARLTDQLAPFKKQLTEHSIYQNISCVSDLRCFMESHVYAVWDFMSLVKKLQLDITTTTLPWQPPENITAARLINEIVWGEESDLDKNGKPFSHFEMYLNAMNQINANTDGIEEMLNHLKAGGNIFEIIDQINLPCYIKLLTLYFRNN